MQWTTFYTKKKDKIMIPEISSASPITDFTTIDMLNVFRTELTMRKYLVQCAFRDNYCFFVGFLSPS